jgi:D-aminopeptidase
MNRILVIALMLTAQLSLAQRKPRARDLGIPFDGNPGAYNAITDVKGVEVGHSTIITGDGALKVGVGPVRTGVTAVLPRGKQSTDLAFAAWFTLNGNGEMTGTTWVEESGFLEGPNTITKTHSVCTVREAVIAWQAKSGKLAQAWGLPVVAETYDGFLNDIDGFHVREKHVFEALNNASGGAVAEGCVGGGTAMNCFGFKCGIGTSSRKLDDRLGGYTVGVLVQSNFGGRTQLRVAGVPVGQEMANESLQLRPKAAADARRENPFHTEEGSIIIVVATDAPLLPHQLKRLARRATLGVARTGGTGGNSSGDIFIAFSTASAGAGVSKVPVDVKMLPNDEISPLFEATAQAAEEAIVNALVAAETMTGRDGNTSYAIPHDRLQQILRKYNRLNEHK